MFLSLKRWSHPKHSRWWNIDPDRMGVLVFTTLKKPEPANLLRAGGVGMSGEGLHVEGRSRTKRKMQRGDVLWLGAATPKKCCRVEGGGRGRRYSMLNQSLLPLHGSFGTVMSSLGHRQERRQTKESHGQEGDGLGEGRTTGGGWQRRPAEMIHRWLLKTVNGNVLGSHKSDFHPSWLS